MTHLQLNALDYVEATVKRDGGTVLCDEFDQGSDGSLVVEATYGAAHDHERVTWTLTRDGELVIW